MVINAKALARVGRTGRKTAIGMVVEKAVGARTVKAPAVKDRTVRTESIPRGVRRFLNSPKGVDIARVYAERSRVMRSTPELTAVRLAGGEKGWITSGGRFMGYEDLRNALHSVDSTSAGAIEGVKLLDMFDALSPARQAEFAQTMQDFDWDEFWKEMYPGGSDPGIDTQMDLYYDMIERLGDLHGWGA